MRQLGCLILAIALLALGGLVAIYFHLDRRQRRKLLERLARELGGQVTRLAEGSALKAKKEGPDSVVVWTRGPMEFRLFQGSSLVELHALPQGATLTPMSVGIDPPTAFGKAGVEAAGGMVALANEQNPVRRKAVRHAPNAKPLELLNDRVVKNIDLIDRLDYTPGGTVEVTDSAVVVSKPSGLKEEGTLRLFLNLAIPIAERAVAVCAVDGIRFVEETKAPGGMCQVCGSGLGAEVVRCANCDTPHHRECWTYVGKCATYACGGTTTKTG
jgi:hypothetical protein